MNQGMSMSFHITHCGATNAGKSCWNEQGPSIDTEEIAEHIPIYSIDVIVKLRAHAIKSVYVTLDKDGGGPEEGADMNEEGYSSTTTFELTFNFIFLLPKFLLKVAVDCMGVEAVVIHVLMELESGTFGHSSPTATSIGCSIVNQIV